MKGYVYILASKRYGTLYTGVTTNIAARICAHRQGKGSAFTRKYKVTRLVLVEEYELVAAALQRETGLKRWKRDWKIALIEKSNPDWNDLYDDLL